MPVPNNPFQSIAQPMNCAVERLDNPHQRSRTEHHLQRLHRLSYSGFVCLLVNTVYFVYRVKCSLDGRFRLPISELTIGWVFLGLELSLAFPVYLGYLGAASSMMKLRTRSFFRLIGDEVPTVDVLITCCGESLDVILDTVRAACALDYPKQRYRVILLDDGNSAELKHQVDILREARRNLFYTARGVDIVTHSKAANINHGLAFVEKLKTGSSEYVAVLDVDMIPMPSMLRALLPHLLNDPSVAMASLPQRFYNIPNGDPLCQCLDPIFDIFLLAQSTSDFCTGSGFVLRRSAAEDIGGIPIDQVCEDMMMSLILRAKGWNIVYVWESLQWGLVPDGYAGHAKQAKRWAQGLASLITTLWDSRLANFSIGQRLEPALVIVANTGSAIALTTAMLFMPAVSISGKPFIVTNTAQQLHNLMTLSALQLVAAWLDGLIVADATGFRAPIWPPYRYPFLAPFQSLGVFGLFFPFTKKYTPSGSPETGKREREARASGSFISRLRVLLGDSRSWPHLFVIVSITVGAALFVKRTLGMDASFRHQLQRLFVGVAWPPAFAHWTMFLVYCWKPISHVVFPPKLHAREALLNRDPDTKVAYPSAMARDGERLRPSQGFAFFVLAYAIFVLAYVWEATFR